MPRSAKESNAAKRERAHRRERPSNSCQSNYWRKVMRTNLIAARGACPRMSALLACKDCTRAQALFQSPALFRLRRPRANPRADLISELAEPLVILLPILSQCCRPERLGVLRRGEVAVVHGDQLVEHQR